MTLAIDGAVSGLNGSYPPTAFNLVTTQDNDVLIVTAGCGSSTYKTVTGITSNPALTWTLRKRVQWSQAGTWNFEEWYAIWTSHGTITITVAVSGVPDIQGWTGIAFGISGANTTTIFDSNAGANPSANGTSANPTVNISTSNANDIIVGLLYVYGGSPSVGSGFTLIAKDVNNLEYGEYKVVTATQSATAVNYTNTATYWSLIADAIMQAPLVPTVPTVTTQAVSSVEEATSTGNGNITATGGENCSKRGVCWNTTGTPTVADFKTEETDSFGTGAFTEAMASLSPGTLYYVRAYAYNSAGYGYGDQVTFTTKPNPPTSLTSTAKTKNSISLSWNKGSGAVTTMIRYHTDQYPTGPTDGTQGYSDTGSSGTVGSLSSGQIYYFRAWSYNAASPSPGYSDDYSSVTEYTRPDDPSSFACAVIDSHEIDLSWTKGTGGDKTMIRRKIGSYPTSVSDGDEVYLDIGTSYNNTGLVGGVHYYYRAWAYDTDSGYYSDSYSQDDDTTTTPILPTGKLLILDKDNNLFRINSSDLTEEKNLAIT